MNTEKQTNKQRQIENLIPYKKGQSGNPNGRPKKGSAIADILNKIGDEEHKKNITKREALLKKTYELAIKGDAAARNFIADRTEGKAIERIEKKDVYEFDYELSELSKLTPDELIREYNTALSVNNN